jgi:hypothetical protein
MYLINNLFIDRSSVDDNDIINFGRSITFNLTVNLLRFGIDLKLDPKWPVIFIRIRKCVTIFGDKGNVIQTTERKSHNFNDNINNDLINTPIVTVRTSGIFHLPSPLHE